MKKNTLSLNSKSFFILSSIVFVILALSLGVSFKTNASLNKKITASEDATRPAELDIVVIKDSSCADCYGVDSLITAIKKENVKINSENTLEIDEAEAQELITEFAIEKVPTLIVTGELEKNDNLNKTWEALGELKNNAFVLRSTGAPYVATGTKEVKGLVEVTLINDESCTECYDVNQHKKILSSFGILSAPVNIDTSSSQGKELINKYDINLVPTVIITGQPEEYLTLKKVWPEVGTVEEDGAYIFREGVKTMGAYKELSTGKIMEQVEEDEEGGEAEQ